jgi:glycerol uptake facilitator-like aquaporin
LNPAVTIGLWTARQVKTAPAVVYIIVQLFGAWVAYELFAYLFNQPVTALYDPNVAGGSAHFELRTLIAEAAGTFVFTIGWAAALYRRYRGPVLGAAIGVSFALGIIVAAVSGFGLINPALALGTRTWHIWSGAGWGTYILGPVVGSVVGFNLYYLLFGGSDKKVVTASASSSSSKTTKSSKSKKR